MLYFWLLRVQSSGRHTFAHRSILSDVPFHSTSAIVLLVSFPRGHVRTPSRTSPAWTNERSVDRSTDNTTNNFGQRSGNSVRVRDTLYRPRGPREILGPHEIGPPLFHVSRNRTVVERKRNIRENFKSPQTETRDVVILISGKKERERERDCKNRKDLRRRSAWKTRERKFQFRFFAISKILSPVVFARR